VVGKPVVFLGEGSRSGAYIILVCIEKKIEVVFGRYSSEEPVAMAAGHYIYIGTAMGETLTSRLLRHVRRTQGKPAHQIESDLIQRLRAVNLGEGAAVGRKKRLHWHVDHLLDQEEAEIVGIIVVRTEKRLEAELGAWLMAMPETKVFAEGLGASDVRGNTHLLRVEAGKDWWKQLPEILKVEFFDTI
jgi:Uri superfamily endonuclease